MRIREITIEDINGFAELSLQLGYEADKSYLDERIRNKIDTEIVFVAADDDGMSGWIDCRISCSYLSKPYGEIVGFIIDERKRSMGIGKQLLTRAEAWMSERCDGRILVHSNIKRGRAHKFYLSNGYDFIKDSKLFRKEL